MTSSVIVASPEKAVATGVQQLANFLRARLVALFSQLGRACGVLFEVHRSGDSWVPTRDRLDKVLECDDVGLSLFDRAARHPGAAR